MASTLADKAAHKPSVKSKAAASEKRSQAPRKSIARKPAQAAEMDQIVARISDWAGGPQQALAWCREVGIPALGGQTAEQLVESGQSRSVMAFLDHIAVGGFA